MTVEVFRLFKADLIVFYSMRHVPEPELSQKIRQQKYQKRINLLDELYIYKKVFNHKKSWKSPYFYNF